MCCRGVASTVLSSGQDMTDCAKNGTAFQRSARVLCMSKLAMCADVVFFGGLFDK